MDLGLESYLRALVNKWTLDFILTILSDITGKTIIVKQE